MDAFKAYNDVKESWVRRPESGSDKLLHRNALKRSSKCEICKRKNKELKWNCVCQNCLSKSTRPDRKQSRKTKIDRHIIDFRAVVENTTARLIESLWLKVLKGAYAAAICIRHWLAWFMIFRDGLHYKIITPWKNCTVTVIKSLRMWPSAPIANKWNRKFLIRLTQFLLLVSFQPSNWCVSWIMYLRSRFLLSSLLHETLCTDCSQRPHCRKVEIA